MRQQAGIKLFFWLFFFPSRKSRTWVNTFQKTEEASPKSCNPSWAVHRAKLPSAPLSCSWQGRGIMSRFQQHPLVLLLRADLHARGPEWLRVWQGGVWGMLEPAFQVHPAPQLLIKLLCVRHGSPVIGSHPGLETPWVCKWMCFPGDGCAALPKPWAVGSSSAGGSSLWEIGKGWSHTLAWLLLWPLSLAKCQWLQHCWSTQRGLALPWRLLPWRILQPAHKLLLLQPQCWLWKGPRTPLAASPRENLAVGCRRAASIPYLVFPA